MGRPLRGGLSMPDWLTDLFARYGYAVVFFGVFLENTGLRVFGAVLAGASGLRWPTFLFYNALGAIAWCTAIACAGYSLAYSWDTLERWIGRSGLIAAVLAAAIAVIVYFRARRTQDS